MGSVIPKADTKVLVLPGMELGLEVGLVVVGSYDMKGLYCYIPPCLAVDVLAKEASRVKDIGHVGYSAAHQRKFWCNSGGSAARAVARPPAMIPTQGISKSCSAHHLPP
eukprot:scaffold126530_cov18-Tisochrysis_lutea.AAC.1